MSEIITGEQESEEQSLSEVLQIRRDKLTELKKNHKNPFEITTFKRTVYAAQITEQFDEFDGKEVSLAGRIMAWRDMGKANFIDVRDSSGKMQVYIKLDDIGEESFGDFQKGRGARSMVNYL